MPSSCHGVTPHIPMEQLVKISLPKYDAGFTKIYINKEKSPTNQNSVLLLININPSEKLPKLLNNIVFTLIQVVKYCNLKSRTY